MTDEIGQILADGVDCDAAGETLSIAPARFGVLLRAMQMLGPALADFARPADRALPVEELLARHAERIPGLMALMLDRPRAWIDELAADEALLLATVLIEVNLDFFVRRVAPAVSGRLTHLTARWTPRGPNPVTNPEATPETMSPAAGPTPSSN